MAKKYDEAINRYHELLKTNDEEKIRRYAFKRIGDCYKSMGKLEQALKAYFMGLDKDEVTPKSPLHTDSSLKETTITTQPL